MLINFCDPRLRPEIQCNTISTDGYEITNLINDSCNGYLAYPCIKPPVHIEIKFFCNIWLSHILIWPTVGSQKSSGFKLYCKNADEKSQDPRLLSIGMLDYRNTGLLFHSSDVDPASISTPANFLACGIRASTRYLTKNLRELCITICKTEKSVPALRKIEVWGTVSSCCGEEVMATVHNLWTKHEVPSLPTIELKNDTISDDRDNRLEDAFEVPESFLDCITWELMTQPIILPSGKIIDLTTLEKHRKSQESWCKPLTDPFTGLQFNNERRPVMATALKSRIDKFLLDNSNQNEIKRIPRVLGRNPTSNIIRDRRIIEIPKCVDRNLLKRTVENIKPNISKQQNNSQNIKKYRHKLPAIIPNQCTAIAKISSKQFQKASTSKLTHNNFQNHNMNNELTIDNDLDNDLKTLLPNMKCFTTSQKIELNNILYKCDCCKDSILYKLPCKHIICRKVLLSIENSQCKLCGFSYKTNEIERIHDDILNR